MCSNYPNPSNAILSDESIRSEFLSNSNVFEIIAQPCCTSKLRYRSDYESNKNRRGVLRSRNNTNYQSPAIRIPQRYLDITEQYYIRVCLVTVINEKIRQRYIHPYDLEDIEIEPCERAIWFPIQPEDVDGIKTFPNLRIVKKKADELKDFGNFYIFESPNNDFIPQLSSVRDTIKEFNLDKAQLAFTIGKKISGNNGDIMISYSHTTIFSEEIIDFIGKESSSENAPSESTNVKSHRARSSSCRMYKYAPQKGFTNSNDEVLIFYTNKIKPRKYGDLQIIFQWNTSDQNWSESALDIGVNDQMVSFRTPQFPFPINKPTSVNIVIKQKKRILDPLIFEYIPIGQCPKCQENEMKRSNLIVQNIPHKRHHSHLNEDDEETDNVIPVYNSQSQQSQSQSERPTVSRPINLANLLPINTDPTEQILDKIAESVTLLFTNNDFKLFFRICRSFIRKRPELLHQAVKNNYSDLIINFISVAPIDLLRSKNEYGETVLLHAIRLNRITIVKNLLEKENSDKFLEDINNKGQNIFHILALNMNSDEILNFLIKHLLKKSINIQEKFDYIDNDNNTPLQLSIIKSNIVCTQYFLKYFNNNIYKTNDNTGDNLIHLAVLYDVLPKMK